MPASTELMSREWLACGQRKGETLNTAQFDTVWLALFLIAVGNVSDLRFLQ
jgi:hypothetical protein